MPTDPETGQTTPPAPTPSDATSGAPAPAGPLPAPPPPPPPPPPPVSPDTAGPAGTGAPAAPASAGPGPAAWGPPGPGGPAGPPWGPPGTGGPAGPARTGGAAVATTLVGSAVTLALGAVVAGVLFATGGGEVDALTNEPFTLNVVSLGLLVAPVALLLSWDEIDLSSIGLIPLGGYIFVEVSDDAVLPGLVLAALAGLVIGAGVGLVRWITGASSALLTIGAGAMASGLVAAIGPGPQGIATGGGSSIDGLGLPLLALIVVVAVAVGLALLDTTGVRPGRAGAPGAAGPTATGPAPQVIPAFALSGLAAALYGGLVAGFRGGFFPGQGAFLLVLVFTAVAIAGVVRGSGVVAPLAAPIGATIALVAYQAAQWHNWDPGQQDLVLGGLLIVCASLAYGLRRLLAPPARMHGR